MCRSLPHITHIPPLFGQARLDKERRILDSLSLNGLLYDLRGNARG